MGNSILDGILPKYVLPSPFPLRHCIDFVPSSLPPFLLLIESNSHPLSLLHPPPSSSIPPFLVESTSRHQKANDQRLAASLVR